MCRGQLGFLRAICVTSLLFTASVACSLYCTVLKAGEVLELALSKSQGVYQLELEMVLDATSEDVRRVLTDYVHIYRINPSISESSIMTSPDSSTVRVRTLVNNCVLFICREIRRVEDVREFGDGTIYSVVVPQFSNVAGSAVWQIRPLGARTEIRYTLVMKLGFYVPPLIGSYIVKQKLEKETLISLNNIERLARIRDRRKTTGTATYSTSLSEPVSFEHGNAK